MISSSKQVKVFPQQLITQQSSVYLYRMHQIKAIAIAIVNSQYQSTEAISMCRISDTDYPQGRQTM
jgi:hypothetical protein